MASSDPTPETMSRAVRRPPHIAALIRQHIAKLQKSDDWIITDSLGLTLVEHCWRWHRADRLLRDERYVSSMQAFPPYEAPPYAVPHMTLDKKTRTRYPLWSLQEVLRRNKIHPVVEHYSVWELYMCDAREGTYLLSNRTFDEDLERWGNLWIDNMTHALSQVHEVLTEATTSDTADHILSFLRNMGDVMRWHCGSMAQPTSQETLDHYYKREKKLSDGFWKKLNCTDKQIQTAERIEDMRRSNCFFFFKPVTPLEIKEWEASDPRQRPPRWASWYFDKDGECRHTQSSPWKDFAQPFLRPFLF